MSLNNSEIHEIDQRQDHLPWRGVDLLVDLKTP